MAMSLPVSPLTPISDIQSTPLNNASNNTNAGSPLSQDQMPPPPLSATSTTNATMTTSTQMKRKPSRRANTAERRATHNAVERQRRETLNGRFLDLASLLPNLSQIRRPSKSSIVNSSIAYIHASRRHHRLASRELRLLKSENDHLRFEINEWRDRAGLMRIEEPVRSEGFSVVISGQMEVVQATPKPGSGLGRARRGEEGDEDEDDGEEGEGEDGMIGLGGYGGSYMDDVEEDVVLDGGPVEEFTSLPSSMPPPPPSMHLHHDHQHHQQQQQQMALNAVIHHSHQAPPPLEDMDDPRIANLLLKNGTNNGFPQPSNFGFQQQQQQQQQQLPYNPHQQYQQQAFSSSYLPDKLWNDHQPQAQYPPTHHQMMQQQEQASRSLLFNPPPLPPPESSLQQYHQPRLSVNTGVGMGGGGGVDLNNDVVGKSSMRGMAIKTKVANAKANARVKASTRGHSHSHSHGSPSHSSHDDSPVSAGSMTIPGNGSSPSPSSSSSHSPHQFDSSHRSGSRSGSESTTGSSPSYELHSPGDYANGGGGVPRRGGGGGGGGMDHVVGFMNGMGLTASGMNMSRGGGMNMAVGGMSGIPGMGYGGGLANSNAMMMMMM